jgi:hypothetical protein
VDWRRKKDGVNSNVDSQYPLKKKVKNLFSSLLLELIQAELASRLSTRVSAESQVLNLDLCGLVS